MKYKLELITDVNAIDKLIAAREELLFILKNDRDDRVIQSIKGEKALGRHTKAIHEAQAKRDSAISIAASLPDGPSKAKQLGIVETQKARLYNLNLPVEASSEEEVVDVEIDKGEREVLIAFHQDVLDKMNERKTQIVGG